MYNKNGASSFCGILINFHFIIVICFHSLTLTVLGSTQQSKKLKNTVFCLVRSFPSKNNTLFCSQHSLLVFFSPHATLYIFFFLFPIFLLCRCRRLWKTFFYSPLLTLLCLWRWYVSVAVFSLSFSSLLLSPLIEFNQIDMTLSNSYIYIIYITSIDRNRWR